MDNWIILTQWGARLVLLILAGLSIWSVAIMIERRRFYKKSENQTEGFAQAKKWIVEEDWKKLQEWADKTPHLAANLLTSAFAPTSPSAEQVDRSVRSFLTEKKTEMERGLTVLATLGSNAPFIGLFGTVLGIIQAFGELAAQTGGTQGVMSSISEALIATAVGLFVAIPAVISYNMFSKKMRTLLMECDALKDLYLSRRGDQ